MNLRVLHVDDIDLVRTFLRRGLLRLGYDVTSAADVASALAALETGSFGVVITDHDMPGGTGLKLVQALHAARFPGRIFVLSGALSANDRAEYLKLGVDGIAAKPIGLDGLRDLLAPRVHGFGGSHGSNPRMAPHAA
jgi:two-component system response regulator PilR (NtrC family)